MEIKNILDVLERVCTIDLNDPKLHFEMRDDKTSLDIIFGKDNGIKDNLSICIAPVKRWFRFGKPTSTRVMVFDGDIRKAYYVNFVMEFYCNDMSLYNIVKRYFNEVYIPHQKMLKNKEREEYREEVSSEIKKLLK